MKKFVGGIVVSVGLALGTLGAGTAGAVPIVGGNGLSPNAWNLVQYVQANYPGVSSIGGVRSDPLPDHPSGHAIDIMVNDMGLGDAIAADMRSRGEVKYVLWRVANHFNHVHVTVY